MSKTEIKNSNKSQAVSALQTQYAKQLSKLNDVALVLSNVAAKRAEDEKTLQVLLHLQEVERRQLHLQLGYSSLHTYAVEKLRYSDGAAHRRVAAMRLLRDVPRVRQQLQTGALNLTTAAQIQTFCRREKKQQPAVKAQLCQQLAGKSKREVEKFLAPLQTAASASMRIPDRIKPVSATHSEIRFTADAQLVEKLEKLQRLHSHKSLNQVFHLALDAALNAATRKHTPKPSKRHIPKQLKQELLHEAGYRCQYIDGATKHRCRETKYLDIDHCQPFAFGGPTTKANLRVLCRAHNLYLAPK